MIINNSQTNYIIKSLIFALFLLVFFKRFCIAIEIKNIEFETLMDQFSYGIGYMMVLDFKKHGPFDLKEINEAEFKQGMQDANNFISKYSTRDEIDAIREKFENILKKRQAKLDEIFINKYSKEYPVIVTKNGNLIHLIENSQGPSFGLETFIDCDFEYELIDGSYRGGHSSSMDGATLLKYFEKAVVLDDLRIGQTWKIIVPIANVDSHKIAGSQEYLYSDYLFHKPLIIRFQIVE